MLGVGAIRRPPTRTCARPGGVSAAIHEFGGPDIAVESSGSASCWSAGVATTAASSAEYVIHIVPRVWEGGGKDEDRRLQPPHLISTLENGMRSIAFPSLYGSVRSCRAVAVGTAAAYLKRSTVIEEIILVAHDDNDYQAYDLASRGGRWRVAPPAQAQAALPAPPLGRGQDGRFVRQARPACRTALRRARCQRTSRT